MKIKDVIMLVVVMMLFSCEGVVIDKDQASRSIQVHGLIEGMKTRVSGNTWSDGDAVGIFMKKSGESLLTGNIVENAKYITDGSLSFSPATDEEKVVFPFNGSNVDFIAYYPHKTAIENFVYPVDVSNQASQSAIDLLYSDNAAGLNSKNPLVAMTFAHQLSKIVLNIQPEMAATDLSGLSVKITNVGTQASFSLADGKLSAPTASGEIIFNTNATGTAAEAILLPTADLSGKDLVFVIGEDTYVYSLSSGLNITSFEKSTLYTYNVTLNPRGVAAIAEGSISDWVTGPSEDIILDPTNEYSTKGTKADPFTVEEAQLKQGRIDVWVTGYIVGSFDGSVSKFVAGPSGSGTNLALANTQNEQDPKNMIPVYLDRVAIKNMLNLTDKPDNLGKKVLIKGDLAAYYSSPALRGLDEAEFVNE